MIKSPETFPPPYDSASASLSRNLFVLFLELLM